MFRWARSQRIENRLVAIYGDGCECEDGDVHAEHLNEWTEGAHEARQIPALQDGRLELKRNGEEPDDDVRHGQIADEEVRHRVHLPGSDDDPYHESIADNSNQAYAAV